MVKLFYLFFILIIQFSVQVNLSNKGFDFNNPFLFSKDKNIQKRNNKFKNVFFEHIEDDMFSFHGIISLLDYIVQYRHELKEKDYFSAYFDDMTNISIVYYLIKQFEQIKNFIELHIHAFDLLRKGRFFDIPLMDKSEIEAMKKKTEKSEEFDVFTFIKITHNEFLLKDMNLNQVIQCYEGIYRFLKDNIIKNFNDELNEIYKEYEKYFTVEVDENILENINNFINENDKAIRHFLKVEMYKLFEKNTGIISLIKKNIISNFTTIDKGIQSLFTKSNNLISSSESIFFPKHNYTIDNVLSKVSSNGVKINSDLIESSLVKDSLLYQKLYHSYGKMKAISNLTTFGVLGLFTLGIAPAIVQLVINVMTIAID